MVKLQKLSENTLYDISRVESSNPDFIEAGMRVFDLGKLQAEFTASDVAEILIDMGEQPTDWRAMGPLMRRAVSFDIIEKTGKFSIAKRINGNTCNHLTPMYRLVDPVFRVPTKLRKRHAPQR